MDRTELCPFHCDCQKAVDKIEQLQMALTEAKGALEIVDHPSGQGSGLEIVRGGKPIKRIIDDALSNALADGAGVMIPERAYRQGRLVMDSKQELVDEIERLRQRAAKASDLARDLGQRFNAIRKIVNDALDAGLPTAAAVRGIFRDESGDSAA